MPADLGGRRALCFSTYSQCRLHSRRCFRPAAAFLCGFEIVAKKGPPSPCPSGAFCFTRNVSLISDPSELMI